MQETSSYLLVSEELREARLSGPGKQCVLGAGLSGGFAELCGALLLAGARVVLCEVLKRCVTCGYAWLVRCAG